MRLARRARLAENGLIGMHPALRRLLVRAVPQRLFTLRRRRVFSDIHRSNGWLDPESVSGPGSTVEATARFRDALDGLLRELGVRSVLDVGCGDGNWIHLLEVPFERYIGVDIVPALVARRRATHAAPGREFHCLDIVRDPLPRADLALCRDCLVHLSNADVGRAVANFRRSGTSWLLATTFTARAENPDIPTGNWRPMNLAAPPFDLGPPQRVLSENRLSEGGAYADKSLGLWRLSA